MTVAEMTDRAARNAAPDALQLVAPWRQAVQAQPQSAPVRTLYYIELDGPRMAGLMGRKRSIVRSDIAEEVNASLRRNRR